MQTVDEIWLLISAALVFLMQAGFLCLESGSTRSKNSINVAAKNLTDFTLAGAAFWLIGFGLMFGTSQGGVIGFSLFAFGGNEQASGYSFFLFQMMFCSTAATLISGAVAERTRFSGYVFITLALTVCIYPIAGHWAWAGAYMPGNLGWLQAMGFVDFAGSTIVHSVGGWMALAVVIIIGPRLGRFSSKQRFPGGGNLPMAALGAMLIWFGWIGFNGGSTLVINDLVPKILLNTFLSAIWGCIASTLFHYYQHRYINVNYSMNGIIAGLVGVTASCHAIEPYHAAVVGWVAGTIANLGTQWLERLRIDDAIAVIPTHLFAGIWGTVCVALFGSSEALATGLSFWQQLQVQVLGIVVIGAFAFSTSFALAWFFNRVHPLRVSPSDEIMGLNISEHRASTELISLLSEMESQQQAGSYKRRVRVEPFTEVGQIARKYNQVIAKVSHEMERRASVIQQFKASERQKGAILDSSMDCIISIDAEGHILEFNLAAEKTFGCIKSRALGLSFFENFALKQDVDGFNASLKLQFSAASGLVLNRRSNVELVRASGQSFPAEVTITSARVERYTKPEFTLHVRDITKEKKLRERLNFLAYKDPLTHLSNRTQLMKELAYETARLETSPGIVALYFLDLDNFKKINDTLGHKAGDALLCEVAARLRRTCRESDIIARLGGDEFVVVMSGEFSSELVHKRASDIIDVMREAITIGDKPYQIPTSVGVAVARSDRLLSADELIQHADIAMYSAKNSGRDNYKIYTREMGEQASRSVNLERKIKAALETGQFRIAYQPKVNASGEVLSLEALVRWNHPEQGEISPGEFIPVAEESHLIVKLGEHVIQLVVATLAKWLGEGRAAVPISVNISSRQLVGDDFIPYIKGLLERSGVPGNYLEIEITEGMLLEDIDASVRVLNELKALNISVAIDDFGTGYSSLSYLKKLPIDILKIDRVFVDECDVKSEDAEICATIINLAKNLKLVAVAEGVETRSQLNALGRMGCTVFQGFYFSKPIDRREIEEAWLPKLASPQTAL